MNIIINTLLTCFNYYNLYAAKNGFLYMGIYVVLLQMKKEEDGVYKNMFTFKVDEITAIYINHENLINKAYNNQVVHCDFHIKNELFKYYERVPSSSKNAQRKRKHEEKCSNQLGEEISELKRLAETGITILKERGIFIQKLAESNSFVQQFLEEERVFSEIRGSNNNKSACITEIQENKYLIPAQCKFFNHDVCNLGEILKFQEKYDLIVMDPPWRNKYIRRVKKARKSLGYSMLESDSLLDIPLKDMIHEKTLLIIWCTNSQLHQRNILDTLLPAWNMKLLAKWYWIKLNQCGATVCDFHEDGKKQPFEVIFIAGHKDITDVSTELSTKKILFSIPSIIHSHKPPLYEIFKKYLPENPNCLELFARYLFPNFTSIGLEVLKLMDLRLYSAQTNLD